MSIRTGYPLRVVFMDIHGPFSELEAGNKHILMVIDYFTRWTEADPIRNEEDTTVPKKLTDEFFFKFSLLKQLH